MNEYELCVIGTVIKDPQTMEQAKHLLSSDFTDQHVRVWDAVLALHERGGLGLRSLAEALRTTGNLENIGTVDGKIRGEDYLFYTTTFAESATIEEFVHQVESNATRRDLASMCSLITADSRSPRDIDEILDEAERRLMALRRTTVDTGMMMGDLIQIFMPRLDGFREGTLQPAWVPQVDAIKEIIDYVDDTEFWINAARPGEGKSSLFRYDAIEGALQGKKTVTFNLENDRLEYAKFAISYLAQIDSAKLKNPRLLSVPELELVREKARQLLSLPWKIISLARPTAKEIDRIARKVHATEGFDLMQVDYIQLIDNGKDNRVQDVSYSTSILRGTAMALGEPVAANSQFSRAIEIRGDNSAPQLSDLRESGSLEQDATIVSAMRSLWSNPPTISQIEAAGFPENFRPDGSIFPMVKAIPIRVYVLKNRNGPIGVSEPIKWIKSTNKFVTLTHEDAMTLMPARDD